MTPFAVFYHVMLNGSDYNINQEKAIAIMVEQMEAMEESSLLDAASEFIVGSNGTEAECVPARIVAGKCSQFVVNGPDAGGELPTLGLLQDWLPTHHDWNVLYLHTKGVSQPDDPYRMVWRRCMMKAVVWNWQSCVFALSRGYDMAGAHWLTNDRYPQKPSGTKSIWGGNFWWAKASYLLTLPPIARKIDPSIGISRYDAEVWVSKSSRRPNVADLAQHWPTLENCSNSIMFP